MPDRDLDHLIAKLKRMPAARRASVIDRLSPSERIQLQGHLNPASDPQDGLSRSFAELIEALRDGPVPSVTAKARTALLAAAAELGSSGATQHLNAISDNPSLAHRLGLWLKGRPA